MFYKRSLSHASLQILFLLLVPRLFILHLNIIILEFSLFFLTKNLQTVTESILLSPIPEDINNVLIEASFISIATTPSPSSPPPEKEEQQEIINRLDDYLAVVAEMVDRQATEALGTVLFKIISSLPFFNFSLSPSIFL